MNILETFKISLLALNANKARSALTMLGVIIGVFAVISLIAVGQGIQNYILDQFEGIGSNLLFVAPGKFDFADDPAKTFSNNKLADKHIDLIETHAKDYVSLTAPSIRLGKTVEYKNKNYFATVAGTNEKSIQMFNLDVLEGRYFTKTEVNAQKQVVVVGSKIKETFFPNVSSLGKKIKVGDEQFEVVGSIAPKGQDFDEVIFIPYNAVMELYDVENFSGIAVAVKDANEVDVATRQIELALLRDLKEDQFSILAPQDILSSIQQILGMLTIGLGAIAGISLIVGGIGIMNIMLVSVTERVREIGLRKAVGATPANIATQFLIEATLLSISGGMIGLFFGWLASFAGRAFIRTEVPWWAVVLAFTFSAVVGIIFGTYPAVQASKKDPIEALRYE